MSHRVRLSMRHFLSHCLIEIVCLCDIFDNIEKKKKRLTKKNVNDIMIMSKIIQNCKKILI